MEKTIKTKGNLFNQDMNVFYSPIINLVTHEIVGIELDLDLEKKSNMNMKQIHSYELDLYSIECGCELISKLKLLNLNMSVVMINVSSDSLINDAFYDNINKILSDYKFKKSNIIFSLSVNDINFNSVDLLKTIDKFRREGVMFELKDFFNDSMSIEFLSKVVFDYLKLDLKYIEKDIVEYRNNIYLDLVLTLTKKLGVKVIMENINSNEDFSKVYNIGCKLGKGDLFTEPLKLDEFPIFSIKEPFQHQLNKLESHIQKSKAKIVIVDDSAISRAALKNVLNDMYDIVECTNGEELLTYLIDNSSNVDVVILDLVMPIMDGFQVLTLIRKNRLLENIPVVVVTGMKLDDGIKALEMGADNVILKPFNKNYILHQIKKTLDSAELKKIKIALEEEHDLLHSMAYYDAMTKCCNRRGLEIAIEGLQNRYDYAILAVDIDNLKHCNDTYGHEMGDLLINTISSTIRNNIRETDIFARTGGDEFILILQKKSKPELASYVASKITTALSNTKIENLPYNPSCSIGLSIWIGSEDITLALKKADEALYKVKTTKKGSYGF